ncbi:MAG: class I SAM-dependent methyltransferase [Thiotrichales bacterium]
MMLQQRRPEPELMDDPAQAKAYAEADFSAPHEHFVALFGDRLGSVNPRYVLDLGCGPGDICRRFARRFPACEVHGIDGAPAMLAAGARLLQVAPEAARIQLLLRRLPDEAPPRVHYDTLISNSLLHHLADPRVLWQAVARFSAPGAAVFVMDLLRPESEEAAARLVETYAANAPEILRRDFYHSLCAAYRPDEVEAQIAHAGLTGLAVEITSDRHWIASGILQV